MSGYPLIILFSLNGMVLFIKSNPVGTIIMCLGVQFYELPITTIPGIVPATSHIQVKGMSNFIST